jgi:DNA adenine methylase
MLETMGKYAAGRLSPFLKWAGGKSQLLETFEAYFPKSFGTYYEPFLGGGAVFFHLASKGRITKAILSDLNKDLINCYLTVRDRLDELLKRLKELQNHARDKEYFYEVVRPNFNKIELQTGSEGDVEKTALLFYLNKTCYNGLYRVNQKDEFNVPWGRYKNPAIYDENNLRAIEQILKQSGITIMCADYNEATKSAAANDFVYFDPPYEPVSSTANFTSYTAESFTWGDQEQLSRAYSELSDRVCFLMLSNSPRVEGLYSSHGYRIERVSATRAISCVGSKRGPVEELLVLNYEEVDV